MVIINFKPSYRKKKKKKKHDEVLSKNIDYIKLKKKQIQDLLLIVQNKALFGFPSKILYKYSPLP